MAEQRQKETLCSDNCCYYPEVRSLNLTRSRCVIRQMVQIWLTSRGFVYGRFATLGRKHRDWHDGPVLAGCRSVCWGLCVSFDQMPMGCWTCVGGGGCWGGLHIGGRHGWWWMFGILDGWACVASLSCEGLKYYNPPPSTVHDVLTELWETPRESFTTQVTTTIDCRNSGQNHRDANQRSKSVGIGSRLYLTPS